MKQKKGLTPCLVLLVLLGGFSAVGLLSNRHSGSPADAVGRSAPAPAGDNTWTNMNPTNPPGERWGHAMAYDAQSDRVILFGGEPGGTWAYDFDTNRWTTLSPSIAPTVVTGHAMAYDAESDRVILFGGDDGFVDKRETWAYDFNTNTWTNLNPPLAPGERSGHAMAYDAESDRVILFGGCVGFPCRSFGDTWAYDFNTNRWTDLNPSLAPNQRSGHMMAYDAQSDRIILFGGYEGNHRGDTWAYDVNANTWTNLSPSSAPRARRAHAMAYGRQSDRVILFGGCIEPCQGGSDLSHETWAYDFNTNTWTNLNPSSTPSRRWLFAMAYDARSDEIILFGGSLGGGATSGETWAYRHYIEPRDIGTVPRAVASVQGVPDARYRSRY